MELARFSWQRAAARLVEGIDTPLLVIILSLSMLGFAALFSASYDVPGRVANQFVSLGIAPDRVRIDVVAEEGARGRGETAERAGRGHRVAVRKRRRSRGLLADGTSPVAPVGAAGRMAPCASAIGCAPGSSTS